MNNNGVLEKILKSYQRYYNVKTEGVEFPFFAEAVFNSHNEQYFLVKSAKVADIDSNEFVFFYNNDLNEKTPSDPISSEKLTELADLAWNRGLSKISPYYGHRNSDVTLIVLAQKISEEAFKKIKKLNFYKSYKMGFFGWSSLRAFAYETSTGRFANNRRASDLKSIKSIMGENEK